MRIATVSALFSMLVLGSPIPLLAEGEFDLNSVEAQVECDRNRKVVNEEYCGKLLCFCGGEAFSFIGTASSEAECRSMCDRPKIQVYPLETPGADGYTSNCSKLDHDPKLSKGPPAGFVCKAPCRPVRTGPIGLYQGDGSGCCLVKTIWTCESHSAPGAPSGGGLR